MEAQIVIDLNSISVSTLGTATGTIYWTIDGMAFPEIGWNDLVLGVIEGWLETTLQLVSNDCRNGKLHFMDGPFYMALKRKGKSLQVSCVKEAIRGEQVLFERMLHPRELWREVIRVGAELLCYCDSHNIHNHDVEKIRRSLVILRNETGRGKRKDVIRGT